MDQTVKVSGGDWQVRHANTNEVDNFVVERANGKHFHITMIDDSVVVKDEVVEFRQPMLFEHDQGTGKSGDVVIQFRRHPRTGRYMVQTETETVFEDETTKHEIIRATRSGVDNIAQAVKKAVTLTGEIYSNPRRIGGKPIKTHFVVANWSPQLASSMTDVYDYVRGPDSMGEAAFQKALAVMEDDQVALTLFLQTRNRSA